MLTSRIIETSDDPEAVYAMFDEEGFIDGHPIIPPTEERVEAFLAYCEEKLGRKGSEVLGMMPHAYGETTIEKVAINAVMAGCRPEYMPVVITAAELLVEYAELLNVDFGSHTEHLWMMVNGPVASRLNIQSGEHGSTGASWRANASIMRAARLIKHNCGGKRGVSGKKSFGYVGAYHSCLAENEPNSPWEPYHVQRGFRPEDSTVSLLAVEPPKHIELGHWSYTGPELLAGFAHSMSTVANRYAYGEYDVIVVLGKDHANTVAAAGFSKADVRRFLYENARTPYGRFGPNAKDGFMQEWVKFYTHSPYAMVPMTAAPDHFHIFVCGGAGPNSLFTGMQRGGVPIKKINLPEE